jgi:uncharacterized protein YlaI
MRASCSICGNESGYDKESLKGSTIKINGCKIIMCCPCEDELLVKLAKRRNIGIKLGDGGEIAQLDVAAYTGNVPERIKLADGYSIAEA